MDSSAPYTELSVLPSPRPSQPPPLAALVLAQPSHAPARPAVHARRRRLLVCASVSLLVLLTVLTLTPQAGSWKASRFPCDSALLTSVTWCSYGDGRSCCVGGLLDTYRCSWDASQCYQPLLGDVGLMLLAGLAMLLCVIALLAMPIASVCRACCCPDTRPDAAAYERSSSLIRPVPA